MNANPANDLNFIMQQTKKYTEQTQFIQASFAVQLQMALMVAQAVKEDTKQLGGNNNE